ncbi:MAG: MarR family transcriptional regulator [Devosia sp.]|nr:MarR family transcriptional regulator [Devosia sp.]
MDAWTRFAEALFRVNGLMLAAGETITRPIGQSSARWQVLGGLGYGPKTVAAMAREIGHARQSVQRVADRLAAEGLVIYRDKPDDRRTSLLELTPAGEAVLGAIFERQVAWSERVTSRLSAEQLDALSIALAQIGDIIADDAETNGSAPNG